MMPNWTVPSFTATPELFFLLGLSLTTFHPRALVQTLPEEWLTTGV